MPPLKSGWKSGRVQDDAEAHGRLAREPLEQASWVVRNRSSRSLVARPRLRRPRYLGASSRESSMPAARTKELHGRSSGAPAHRGDASRGRFQHCWNRWLPRRLLHAGCDGHHPARVHLRRRLSDQLPQDVSKSGISANKRCVHRPRYPTRSLMTARCIDTEGVMARKYPYR